MIASTATTPPDDSIIAFQEVPPSGGPWDGRGHREPVAEDSGLVLLVEDDFMLRNSLAEVLSNAGYGVTCAANGLDALRRLGRQPKPALILLDIMMPHMDGIEFRAVQRKIPAIADIPVIVLTAVGVPPEAAEELDLRKALFKPIDTTRLLAAVRRWCSPNP